ncbi:unnamed protein product, partial [Ectocarpus fasciculatus]
MLRLNRVRPSSSSSKINPKNLHKEGGRLGKQPWPHGNLYYKSNAEAPEDKKNEAYCRTRATANVQQVSVLAGKLLHAAVVVRPGLCLVYRRLALNPRVGQGEGYNIFSGMWTCPGSETRAYLGQ